MDSVGDTSVRAEMVEKAAKFLLDEKVRRTDPDVQNQFLKNKGLTEEEISEAKSRANEQNRPIFPSQADHLPNVSYQQHPPTPPRLSKWADYANSVVLAGGVTYLTVQFVKNYIMPKWLGVPTKQEKQMQALHDNMTDVQNNLKFLVDSVQQTLISVQRQQDLSDKLLLQLNVKGDDSKNLEKVVSDLRNEVSVVKSLLLSRDQFPPMPTNKPFSLPSWQQIRKDNCPENEVSLPSVHTKKIQGDFNNNGLLNGTFSCEKNDEDDVISDLSINADEKVTPV